MNRLMARVAPSPLALPDGQRDKGPEAGIPMAEGWAGHAGSCCPRWPLQVMRRVAWGLLLGPSVALSLAGGTQSARAVLQRWHAPFFITCFCCAGNLLLFPFYYLGQLVGAEKRQGPTASFRQCSAFLGEEGVTLRAMLRTAAPFSVLWSLSCYLYLLALRRISAGDASAILCCSPAFAFLLSWIGLRDTFMGVRIVGTILSVTGIVMMAYADGFHGDSIMGVALAVGSACASALFKVLLRRRVGEEQPGGASVLLSCVGMCGTVLQSWLSGLLCLTGVEDWPATQDAAWGELCLAGLLSLCEPPPSTQFHPQADAMLLR
ncbi:solute carrier family 35 member F4 [Paramormyrops kingsleyae]|uniref:solute carrier family 35 member F4 n=1 Tax=Paramormyrops kingsleyae TaxID=1676925 RepID=UPI003B97A5E6